MAELPKYLDPMLCKLGDPFSSDKHIFEIKWDGTRALTLSDESGVRMHNRNRYWMKERYPDLGFLEALPAGTVLDGEIVVLQDGKPDFSLCMSRDKARGKLRIEEIARTYPATYMVFDLPYQNYEPLFDVSLTDRRERLREVVESIGAPHLVLSEAVPGDGQALYRAACEQELEGIVAKEAQGRYYPGKRSDSWTKIKRSQDLLCAIIGYVARRPGDVRSLIIAIEEEGELRCVGKVGSGLSDALRDKLWKLFESRARSEPLIPCKHEGSWIEPGLYCQVKYLERTRLGELRAPVFKQLIEE